MKMSSSSNSEKRSIIVDWMVCNDTRVKELMNEVEQEIIIDDTITSNVEYEYMVRVKRLVINEISRDTGLHFDDWESCITDEMLYKYMGTITNDITYH